MIKCPKCGSSAQPRVIDTQYMEKDWTIKVIRIYKCGCGHIFTGTSYYQSQECYEIIEDGD